MGRYGGGVDDLKGEGDEVVATKRHEPGQQAIGENAKGKLVRAAIEVAAFHLFRTHVGGGTGNDALRPLGGIGAGEAEVGNFDEVVAGGE